LTPHHPPAYAPEPGLAGSLSFLPSVVLDVTQPTISYHWR